MQFCLINCSMSAHSLMPLLFRLNDTRQSALYSACGDHWFFLKPVFRKADHCFCHCFWFFKPMMWINSVISFHRRTQINKTMTVVVRRLARGSKQWTARLISASKKWTRPAAKRNQNRFGSEQVCGEGAFWMWCPLLMSWSLIHVKEMFWRHGAWF